MIYITRTYYLNPFTDFIWSHFLYNYSASKHMIQCQEAHDVSDHIRNEHFLDFLDSNQTTKNAVLAHISFLKGLN